MGIDRLSIGDVTAVVGIKYSTFYRYFPHRDALLTAMIEQAFVPEIIAGPGATDPGDPDAVAALERVARHLNAVLDRHPGLASTLVTMSWPSAPIATLRDGLVERLGAAGVAEHTAAAAADLLISSIVFTHHTSTSSTAPRESVSDLTREQVALITTALGHQP
ncbi:hypothetical protein AD006_30985 (plasmid) [Pseudonocardia sp. EC080610-09]|uniref:TetR/AcrR family transcriptional regulator n=1 Tax=unclassified Pseudonocardia TaxID=2619320 RepID=UPI00070618DF|nr:MULTISPECIES: TetR/AcrR family transcriptional regulator [unclassified Pseudonocardia]ALL79620.1 hypothetical protein AD006_30985 [Pseudonocardia sp. EC080610-09]ALL85424.1 hypothetical protein AD017_30250 [Pseudonocardia sp. EC080619-01]